MGQIFENKKNIPQYSPYIVYREGMAKGVRITENNGVPNPALVVDGEYFLNILY